MSEYFEAWKNSRFIAGDGRRGTRLRRHLSPLGHRRHPRRHPRHLRRDRTDDRGREPPAGETDPQGAARPWSPSPPTCATARRRREIHRQAGRRARRPGPGPGRGDRRPGDAGREAARTSNCRKARAVRRAQRPPPASTSLPSRRRGPALRLRRLAPRPSRPGRRADAIRADLFEAQSQLLFEERDGDSVAAAEARLEGPLRRGLAPSAPAELREVEALAARGRAGARRARRSRAGGRPGTDRLRPAPRRPRRRGRRGARWRSGRARSLAADPRLPPDDPLHPARGRRDRGAAAARRRRDLAARGRDLQIEKDLLDTFQARLITNLDEAAQAAERGFDGRFAETAAIVRGYWLAIAPEYGEQRSAAERRATDRDFERLAAAGPTADRARSRPPGARVEADLEGFTAAPLTPDEQVNRASQLTRFLDLVPKEYDKGTADGRVTIPFEMQEAVAFMDGVEAAFSDLEPVLLDRDPAAVANDRGGLRGAARRTSTTPSRASPSPTRRSSTRPATGPPTTSSGSAPQEWTEPSDEADYELVDISLDQLEAAAGAGQYQRGRAGAARRLRLLRVRPGAEAARLRPPAGARNRGTDLVRRQRRCGPRQPDRRQRAAARDPRDPAHPRRKARRRPGADRRRRQRDDGDHQLGADRLPRGPRGDPDPRRDHRQHDRPARTACAARSTAAPCSPCRPASLMFLLALLLLDSLSQYGEKLEAAVGVVAIGVLLLVMNWFFHRVYWTEWIKGHRERGKALTGAALAAGAGRGDGRRPLHARLHQRLPRGLRDGALPAGAAAQLRHRRRPRRRLARAGDHRRRRRRHLRARAQAPLQEDADRDRGPDRPGARRPGRQHGADDAGRRLAPDPPDRRRTPALDGDLARHLPDGRDPGRAGCSPSASWSAATSPPSGCASATCAGDRGESPRAASEIARLRRGRTGHSGSGDDAVATPADSLSRR